MVRTTTKRINMDYECDVEEKHAGKYVVIIGGKVFAYGPNPDVIIKRARRSHPDEIPFMYRVPSGESMLL